MPVSELDRLAGSHARSLRSIVYTRATDRMQILHDFSLRLPRGKALCLVGPNGAGKSTVLNAIYGFARIFSGTIDAWRRATSPSFLASAKLKTARIAYVLQRDSVSSPT